MKKIKLLFAVLAAVAGAGGAVASNIHTKTAASAITYEWINWNNETVLMGLTQEQAQLFCSGSLFICLRAKHNTNIYTVGDFAW
ncbi:hypothetical protein [Chitinophaga sp. S165]|uniref:hypothetical protein n=1 Tax=Chitinophaga sp. S165 TaxID=2135462 RepID=UPI000D717D44|nr:hypothetical protein [Chitinophaga sp. S165]PWV49588.1 hypothetical protein C7475_10596 [Chitinophaga sp. S165]